MSQTVKPGYKQTEVGVIPEEWEVKLLPEVLRFRSGKAHEQHISDAGKFVCVNSKFISTDGKVRKYSTANFCPAKKGDVLMVMSDLPNGRALAKAYLVEEDDTYAVNQRVCTLSPYRDCSEYFFYALNRHPYFLKFDDGVSQTHLLNHVFQKCPIQVPPNIEEQRAIATALSDVDALLAALDRLIAKQRDLKQAAMQQLLTGQTRLPGFGSRSASWHRSVFGVFPSDWTLQPLSQVSAFITKGSTPTTYGFQWVSSGVLFLRSECVSERGLDLSQSMFVSPQAHQMLKRSEVKAGDLLMTITGNVGRVVHLNEDFPPSNINQHIARIRMKDDHVAVAFVFHFLSQPLIRKYYNQITTGQAYPQISLTQVRATILPLPPLPEQTAIATVLSDMDLELAALEQRRDKTRALKQGMMQELLTGKTRLI
jgi:type I restriction enzyme S subunit